MNKEEILERSRQENRKRDEMEADIFARAGQLATAVGGIVCMAVILLEGFLAGRVNYGTWAVYLSMAGSMLLGKYRRLNKKHELIFGIAELALAAAFFVMFVLQLVR